MIKIIAQVVGSGPRGETGPQGDQGIQGEQGLKGDKGDQGLQGIQGPQGIKGDKGDTGDQGIQGVQGLQGIQGVKGDTGDDGYTPVKGVDYFTDTEITEILAPVNSQLAERADINNTVQKIIFNGDGTVQRIRHESVGGEIIREDTFAYGVDLITEVRTLISGGTLTFKYHLDTLITEVL